MSGVHPLGAAGVGAAVAMVVLGLGISLWRLSQSVTQLYAHGSSHWEWQKSGSARLDRLESRLTDDRTLRPTSLSLPVVPAPTAAEPPSSMMPAPLIEHHSSPEEIAARIEAMLGAAQRAIADSVRDGVRKELLAQQDEAEHRYMLMTDLITAMRSEMAEIGQLLEARRAAPGRDAKD